MRSPFDHTPLKGILVMKDGDAGPVRLLDADEAADELGLADHRLTFTSLRALPPGPPEEALLKITAALQRCALLAVGRTLTRAQLDAERGGRTDVGRHSGRQRAHQGGRDTEAPRVELVL